MSERGGNKRPLHSEPPWLHRSHEGSPFHQVYTSMPGCVGDGSVIRETVCMVGSFEGLWGWEPRVNANLKLICAAPRMLAILETVRREFIAETSVSHFRQEWPEIEEIINECK